MKRLPVAIAVCVTLGVVLIVSQIVSVLIAQHNLPPGRAVLYHPASDTAKKIASSGADWMTAAEHSSMSVPSGVLMSDYPGGSGSGMGMGSGGMGSGGMGMGMGMGMGVPEMMGSGYPGGPALDLETARAFSRAVWTLQSDAADEAQKEAARKLIADQLRRQFDLDLADRRKQIEELERKITQLREQLEKRQAAKDRLVELRITLLENESAGLSFPQYWDQLPGLNAPLPGMESLVGGGTRPPTPAQPMGGSLGMSRFSAPSLQDPAEQAMNSLGRIYAALISYHDVHKTFPAAYSVDSQGTPLLSWRVHILPFLGRSHLYAQFHLDEPWDSPHNRELIRQMPDTYEPRGISLDVGETLYLGNAGPHGIFIAPREGEQSIEFPRGISLADITDGIKSNTIMVVEGNKSSAVVWTQPKDFVFDELDDPLGAIGGFRDERFMYLEVGNGMGLTTLRVYDRSLLKARFRRNVGESAPASRLP